MMKEASAPDEGGGASEPPPPPPTEGARAVTDDAPPGDRDGAAGRGAGPAPPPPPPKTPPAGASSSSLSDDADFRIDDSDSDGDGGAVQTEDRPPPPDGEGGAGPTTGGADDRPETRGASDDAANDEPMTPPDRGDERSPPARSEGGAEDPPRPHPPKSPPQVQAPKRPHLRSPPTTTPSSPSRKSSAARTKPPSSSPKRPASSAKPAPQSQRATTEDSFGPFVAEDGGGGGEEWNPFGGDEIPSDMFHVDDDDEHERDRPYGGLSNGGGGSLAKKGSKGSGGELAGGSGGVGDALRRAFDSEYERALEDQSISWRARRDATRLSFLASALLMVAYLWLGCMFYRSEAGWSVPDALLFTVYTVTTVGYGGPQPLPNTAAFHAFTSAYVLVGISLVTVLGAHTYQLVTLEAARIRTGRGGNGGRGGPRGEGRDGTDDGPSDGFGQEGLTREMDKYRQQFMSELEDLVRERPLLDAAIVKAKEVRTWLRTTRPGRFASVALPFSGLILFGALVVGSIEEWSPLESVYWSIVTLTTVGYGDYVPTRNSSVWFCTLFFIPSSLFFLSFFLAHVAKAYIRLHAVHVTRLERKMRRKSERRRVEAARAARAKRNQGAGSGAAPSSSNGSSTPTESPGSAAGGDDVEKASTQVFSYDEEDDRDNSVINNSGLFGDQAGMVDSPPRRGDDPDDVSPAMRYRENVIRNRESAPDPSADRAVTFAEALQSVQSSRGPDEGGEGSSRPERPAEGEEGPGSDGGGIDKPSLEVRLRVQARLARIIAEEVAGHQTGVIIKGSTVSLTVGSLRDTADKWRIPPQAWKAFRAVAFRSLLFAGERELITAGGDALLGLNVVEFHQIFSPMLAAMGDGESMEAWLAATDVLADVELRGGARYGRGKPVFTGTFT